MRSLKRSGGCEMPSPSDAIKALIGLGLVRSKRLVADLGEEVAARVYGVSLPSNPDGPGYDLVTRDGRSVQVRVLRSEPDRAWVDDAEPGRNAFAGRVCVTVAQGRAHA